MSDEALPAAGSGEAASAGIARNAFFLVLGQVATTALAIVLSAALGRSLGTRDFGVYYLITTMCTFAYVFVEWGQPYFVIREVAREPHRAGELLGTGLAMRAVFTLAITVPVGLVAWALGYGARTTWLAIALILASLPLFLNQAYGMVFRARDQMGRDATVSVANKAIALTLTLPALALGLGIPGVILAQGLAGLCALALAHSLFRRLRDKPRLHPSRAAAREVFTTGIPILAMSTAVSAQPYLDAIVLSQLAPTHVMGWFGAAKNILGTLMAPAVILGAAAYPRIARVSHERVALRREVKAAFRPLLWLGALAGTGTYLFAPAVVGLIYGSQAFGPAALILQVFAPGLFLLFVDILLGNIIYASGYGTQLAIAKVVSVVVGTALDIALIPVFQAHMGNGGIGVMVAFAISEFVVFAGALRALPSGILDPRTLVDVARALGAAVVPIVLFRLLPTLPFWLGIPLCVVSFAAAAQLFGLMGVGDLGVVSTMLRRRGVDV
jgi:O-antigen/teichoic acid export membrane protein